MQHILRSLNSHTNYYAEIASLPALNFYQDTLTKNEEYIKNKIRMIENAYNEGLELFDQLFSETDIDKHIESIHSAKNKLIISRNAYFKSKAYKQPSASELAVDAEIRNKFISNKNKYFPCIGSASNTPFQFGLISTAREALAILRAPTDSPTYIIIPTEGVNYLKSIAFNSIDLNFLGKMAQLDEVLKQLTNQNELVREGVSDMVNKAINKT